MSGDVTGVASGGTAGDASGGAIGVSSGGAFGEACGGAVGVSPGGAFVLVRLYQLIGSCPCAGKHHQHKLVEVDVAVIVLVRLGKH